MTGVRARSHGEREPDAAARDFALWEAELRPRRLARWGGWLLRAFGDVAHRDGFVLVTGGGVCWHCYVPADPGTRARTSSADTRRR
jgi:hypothetical protein